jgi:membrane associated rhomboid family serine protease
VETCYRHPNRETGVRCSNCERPICPDCMTSTPVGMRCPECARQRTRVRTMRSTTADPRVTYVLIGINVLVGIGLIAGGTSGEFGNNTLYDDGALAGPLVADGEVWRLVTSGFIHGTGAPDSVLLHLLFNMFGLYILGTMLEPALGHVRFGILYFVSLLAGSFGALVVTPDSLTAGASGAVFGLLGAGVVFMWNRGLSPLQSGLGIWLVIALVFTFSRPDDISIGGHVGGLVGGVLCALALVELPERMRGLPPMLPTLVCVAVGVASVVGAVAVA